MSKIEELEAQRDENFKRMGQCYLQKIYYEQEIKNLMSIQEELCNKIYNLYRKCD